MNRPALRAIDVRKSYGRGDTAVRALDGVSVAFETARFTAIVGPSGSGKSTLMHCLAGLDTVDAGEVWVGDREITGLSDRALTGLRRDRLGFVFQAFNLLPQLTAIKNITLPLDLAGRDADSALLEHLVDRLGLTERLGHLPAELSGGQQQRVAIARALITKPQMVFADEPTGNLDSTSSRQVLTLLGQLTSDLGLTVVMVTHDAAAAAHAHRVIVLRDGQIVNDLNRPVSSAVTAAMAGGLR